MTDMVKKFSVGTENLGADMRAQGFKKGAEAINLAAIFRARNIVFDDNGENNL